MWEMGWELTSFDRNCHRPAYAATPARNHEDTPSELGRQKGSRWHRKFVGQTEKNNYLLDMRNLKLQGSRQEAVLEFHCSLTCPEKCSRVIAGNWDSSKSVRRIDVRADAHLIWQVKCGQISSLTTSLNLRWWEKHFSRTYIFRREGFDPGDQSRVNCFELHW